jgi:hypothetical protein
VVDSYARTLQVIKIGEGNKMTNPIGRRLDRLERTTNRGYGPVFRLIDDPRDPENAKRLEEAGRFRRDNPNGLMIHHVIVHPPNGESDWEHVSREERERYLAAYSTNVAFGSSTDIERFPRRVCFPPESGHSSAQL